MVFAVEATIAFGTAARRDQALTRAQAFFDSHSRWGSIELRAIQEGTRHPNDLDTVIGNGIYLNARLSVRADMDNIVADLQARPGIVGGWIQWHLCEHDVGDGSPCHDVTMVQL